MAMSRKRSAVMLLVAVAIIAAAAVAAVFILNFPESLTAEQEAYGRKAYDGNNPANPSVKNGGGGDAPSASAEDSNYSGNDGLAGEYGGSPSADAEIHGTASENEGVRSKVELLLDAVTKKYADIARTAPDKAENRYGTIRGIPEYGELVAMGVPAKDAVMEIFAEKNGDGPREYVMACACAEIMGASDEQKGLGTGSGREWFYKFGLFENDGDFLTVDADFDRFPRDMENSKNIILPPDTDMADMEEVMSNYILARKRRSYYKGEKAAEAHKILATGEEDGILNVYMMVRFGWFGFEDGKFALVSGSGGYPARMRLKKADGKYRVLEYRELLDGGLWNESLRELFPADIVERILKENEEIDEELKDMQKKKAEEYLEEIGREEAPVEFGSGREKPDKEARNAIYLVTLMRREFPEWNGTREILVRAGGPAPGTKIRCTLKTLCEKEKDGRYIVTLSRNWDITINGVRPASVWKYEVSGEIVELISREINDYMIGLIK